MKVLVLGSTGMLGNAVGRYFENDTEYDVTLTYRNDKVKYGDKTVFFDATSPFPFDGVEDNFDYVINCIGTIKPFMASNPRDARYINSVFPYELAEWGNSTDTKIIHITTDCVFTGNKGKAYNEDDAHDASDDYGKSKSLGEPVDECMVIRTSIIGEEIHKNASLLEWAKARKGKEVKGFTNHLWNGITTDQYAKCCQQIIDEDLWQKGLWHVHAKDTVNKLQMVEYFSEKFDLDLKIKAFETPKPCDRSLSSKYDLTNKLNVPTVKEQVFAL